MKRFWKFFWALAGILCLVAFLLATLLTDPGLKSVIVPVVSDLIPGHLQIEGGTLRLMEGSLEIHGLRYTYPAAGIRVEVGRILLEVEPLSFLTGPAAVIRNVEAEGASLLLQTREERSDKEPAGVPRERPGSRWREIRARAVEWVQGLSWIGTVEKGRIDGFSFRWNQDGLVRAEAGPAELGFARDSTRQRTCLSISAPFSVHPGLPERAFSGTVLYTLQAARSLTRDLLTWKGETAFDSSPGLPWTGMNFTHELRAELETEGSLGLQADLKALRGAKELGDLKARLRWKDSPGSHASGPSSEEDLPHAELTLRSLDADFVNPFLAASTVIRAAGGTLEAQAKLQPSSSEAAAFHCKVDGQAIRLENTEERQTSPPFDFRSELAGSWSPVTSAIEVRKLDTHGVRGGKDLISVSLDRPLSLASVRKRPDAGPPPPEAGHAHKDPGVNLLVVFNGITRQEIGTWYPPVLRGFYRRLAHGPLDGNIRVTVLEKGRNIECSGKVHAPGFVVQDTERKNSLGPVVLDATFDGTVRDLAQVEIEEVSLILHRDGRVETRAEVRGSWDVKRGAATLGVDLEAEAPFETLGSLVPLNKGGGVILSGGSGKSTWNMTLPGDGSGGCTINGRARFENLVFASPAGQSLTGTFLAEADARIRPGGKGIDLKRLQVDAGNEPGQGDPKGPAGRVTLQGLIPLHAQGPAAQVNLKVNAQEVRASPWLHLVGLPWDLAMGDLPLSADLDVHFTLDGKVVIVEGQEQVRIRLPKPDQGEETVALQFRNRWERRAQTPDRFHVEVTGQRPPHPEDRMDLTGTVQPAGPGADSVPCLDLQVQVDRLDVTPYLSPTLPQAPEAGSGPAGKPAVPQSGPGTPGEAAARRTQDGPDRSPIALRIARDARNLLFPGLAAGVVPAAKPAAGKPVPGKPGGAPGDPTKDGPDRRPPAFQVKLNARNLLFRDLEVTNVTAAAAGRKNEFSADLKNASTANGLLQGHMEVTEQDGRRRISWNLTGSGLEVGKILTATQPGKPPSLTGTLSFENRSTGTTGPEGKIRDNLSGSLGFDLTHGRIGKSSLFHFIARKTGIPVFDMMVFDLFHGDVNIDQGKATLQDVYATGMAAQIVFAGEIGLRGDFDLSVYPRLGPNLSGAAKGTRYAKGLLRTVEGFLSLPVVVTVRGIYPNLRYGFIPQPQRILGHGTDLILGTVGGVIGVGRDMVKDTAEQGPVGLLGPLRKGGAAVGDTVQVGKNLAGETAQTGDRLSGGLFKAGAEAVKGLFRKKRGEDAKPAAPEEEPPGTVSGTEGIPGALGQEPGPSP